MRPPGPIGRSALRGTAWTIFGYAAVQLVRFAGNVVLTRLLFPAAFGQVAIVFIFIQGLQMFSDVGAGPAIVQSPHGDEPRFLNTAWTIGCLRGVVLWLASALIAAPVAALYDQPLLRWLIPAAGLSAVLGGFTSISVYRHTRHLQVARLTILELAVQVAGSAANVVFALADRWAFGPDHPGAAWAMVLGGLTAAAARLALSHRYLEPFAHRFELDRESLGRLMRFGRWVLVSTLLTFLAAQADRLAFGRLVPIDVFGVYSMAVMLAAVPTEVAAKLGSAVVFPAFSRLLGRSDFRVIFWKARGPMLIGGAALVSGLVAAGPPLVGIVFDARFAAAGVFVQYLGAAAWFRIVDGTNVALLLAQGRIRWVAASNAAKVAGLLLAVPLGYVIDGFAGALAGVVVSEAARYLVSGAGVARAGIRVFPRDAVLTVALAATAVAGAGAGSLAARWGLGAAFAAAGVAATVAWVGAGAWCFRRFRWGAAQVGVDAPPAA